MCGSGVCPGWKIHAISEKYPPFFQLFIIGTIYPTNNQTQKGAKCLIFAVLSYIKKIAGLAVTCSVPTIPAIKRKQR